MGMRVDGQAKVDKTFDEKFAIAYKANRDLLEYYNSNTKEGAPVWRNLSLYDHDRLIKLGEHLIKNASEPYSEKFRQSENKRMDFANLTFFEFVQKWGWGTALIFSVRYDEFKKKYTHEMR